MRRNELLYGDRNGGGSSVPVPDNEMRSRQIRARNRELNREQGMCPYIFN